jgi:hypothetical protein
VIPYHLILVRRSRSGLRDRRRTSRDVSLSGWRNRVGRVLLTNWSRTRGRLAGAPYSRSRGQLWVGHCRSNYWIGLAMYVRRRQRRAV